jgi:hypothetical protein
MQPAACSAPCGPADFHVSELTPCHNFISRHTTASFALESNTPPDYQRIMAPIPILDRGTYEHYKTRNKAFINWLTDAARKCCKLEDFVVALEGQAGKKAKQNGEEVLLTTSEIISLCKKVAENEKMMIPDRILPLLKTIIAKRTEYAAFHSTLSAIEGSASKRSNAGHAHFIDVLQQAHDIFAALDKSRFARRNRFVSIPKSKSLGNLFEHLAVEDAPGLQRGGAGFEAAAEAELEEDEFEQRAADPRRTKFKVKVDDEEEILVQLVHLLGDFNTLREGIEDTFAEYIRGEVTHEVACTVASVGFGLIRRTCERFTDQHPEFGDYAYMLNFFGFRMDRHGALVSIHLEGKDKQATQPSGTGASMTEKTKLTTPSLTKIPALCASGANIILQLNDELQSPEGLQEPESHSQQRHGFAQLLHNGISEFRRLKKHPKILVPELGSWYGDEFMSGILNYAYGEQQGLPIWLAVITECYRNIHDILGGKMDVGAQFYSNKWIRIRGMMDSAVDFEYCKGEGSDTQNKDHWSERFEWLRSAPKSKKVYVMGGRVRDVAPPTYLIDNLPTVTGGVSFLPISQMYMDGCEIANTNAVVHCAAHLYSACLHTGLISSDLRWADMEFFLERHKMYTITVPGADNFSMLNRFLLDLGVRGTTLANCRVKPKRADIRRLLKIFPSSRLVWKLVQQWSNAGARGKEVRDVSMMDVVLEALANCSNSNSGSKSSKRTGKVYTPIELLSVFKKHLIVDEPERNFNMIAFSQACSILLDWVRHETSRNTIVVSSTASPHKVTSAILADSAQLLNQGLHPSHTLLSTVSRIIYEIIPEYGDQYSAEAYEMSSGQKPR